MKFLLILAFCSTITALVSGSAVIDSSLKKRFLGGGGDTQNVMVSFTQGIQTVIQQINKMNFSSIAEKRTVLTNAQQTFTNTVQKPLQTFLNTMGVQYESFWISNKMVVPNANSALVQSISSIQGVSKIEKEPVVNIQLPMEHKVQPWSEDVSLARQARQTTNSWGIAKIRANNVWASYKGKGIVVAGIDTGVRYTHETLAGRWRRTYGWYDPYQKTATPNDQNGHGTHTMGTIVGSNGIGVAPEATWIACKGCSSDSCGGSQLYTCGQWVQCPTNTNGGSKNCGMAPDVVSNSWGSPGGQTWYDDVIDSWHASGIIPVFSIGNSGPDCNTAGSPGDNSDVIAVGSTESNEQISYFSSLGPSSLNSSVIKPDIVAPGGAIVSAWNTTDSAYARLQGTSMACPHVSGVVVLMLQKRPSLTYEQVYTAITKTAIRTSLDTSTAKTCNNKSPTSFPNNAFGYGRIDAVNSVNAV